MSEYDSLWVGNPGGPVSWYSRLPQDQKVWLEGLADDIIQRGSEPFWQNVVSRFEGKFGTAPSRGTITSTVRKLVKERQ